MKKYLKYHLISVVTMIASLAMTATHFDETEIRAVILYSLFMVGHYLYLLPHLADGDNNTRKDDFRVTKGLKHPE